MAGFAGWGCGVFKAFGGLVLVHGAQVALFSIAQCLTLRSSRPAFCGPLILSVSLRKIRNIEAHVLFTGVYLLKRLFVGFWISRRASPFGAAPVFSFFASIASLPWHTAFSRFALVVNLGLPILASVANRAVKPTCLRQAAYFRSLVPSYSALCRPAFTPAVRLSHRFLL